MVAPNKAISRIRLSLEIVKILPDGSEESRISECNSWLKQWVEIISLMMSVGQTSQTTAGVVDTADASQTIEALERPNVWIGPHLNSLAADNTFGIQVGTGTGAVNRDDNKLFPLIAEGAAATQLNYLATIFSAKIAISGGYRFTISRQVNNNSGGTITVEEIGMAALTRISGPATANFLILRDLVTEAIPDTESRVFRYHLDFIA